MVYQYADITVLPELIKPQEDNWVYGDGSKSVLMLIYKSLAASKGKSV